MYVLITEVTLRRPHVEEDFLILEDLSPPLVFGGVCIAQYMYLDFYAYVLWLFIFLAEKVGGEGL